MPKKQADYTIPRLRAKARVLVVDDKNINCLVAWNYCEAFGCEVVTASDGAEAVNLCASESFDLVLMDIRMPRMNGVEASKKIRALPGRAGEFPIIAVTGDGDLSDHDTRACNFRALLLKPITMHSLFSAAQDALAATCAPAASGDQAA